MQKEIQLTDKTLLVVGLPEEANRFKMFPDIGSQPYLSYFIGVETHREYVGVGFELLGIYPELTEEQLATIGLDLESFQSLMERERLFLTNPYIDVKCHCFGLSNKCKVCKDFQEAEQTTFPKYAILIKSK